MVSDEVSTTHSETISSLDDLIHQKTRLTIMSYLFVNEEADMIFLKRKTVLTWGNLSSHALKLEEAGYIEMEKSIVSKKTRTVLRITELGKEAYTAYRTTMFAAL